MNMIRKYYDENFQRPFYTPGRPFAEEDARDFAGMLTHEWQTDEKGGMTWTSQLGRLVTRNSLSL
jgi:hypothetical protein